MMLIKIFHLLGQWSIAFVPKMKLDCVLCNTGVLVQRTIIITTSINVKMNFFSIMYRNSKSTKDKIIWLW